MSTEFRRLIAQRAGKDRRGVEFGASFNPVAPKAAGFNVITVDHMSREGLREKYRGQPVDVSQIETVDAIWDGTGPVLGVPTGTFDYVIASHVIEHVPDLVRFLKVCEGLLSPQGELYLLIPDKRFCFDHYRPGTTTGQVLEAYVETRVRPSGGQVFDHYAFASSLRGKIAWSDSESGIPTSMHGLDEAYALAQQSWTRAAYQDVHCWVFTLAGFRLVIRDLRQLGFIDLEVTEFKDSVDSEFFVCLARANSGPIRSERLDLMRQAAHPSVRFGFSAIRRATRPLRAALRQMPVGSRILDWLARVLGRR